MTRRILTSNTLVLLLITLLTLSAYGAGKAADRRQLVSPGDSEPAPMRPIATAPDQELPLPGIVIVKLRPQTEQVIGYGPRMPARTFGLPALDAVLGQYNVQAIERTFPTKTEPPRQPLPDLSKIYTLHLPPGADEDLLVAQLNRDPAVEYAERVYMAYTDGVPPNDPEYYRQIHFARIAAETAWDIQQGDSAVVVAIIDTGVDWDHEDLAANIWINTADTTMDGIDDDENGYIDDSRGWDFVDVPPEWPAEYQPASGEDGTDPDNDPDDFDGHGTHCAGIASAVTDNGIGIAGTGWNTTIMPVRVGYLTAGIVFPGDVGGIAWGYEGILYAVDSGADIISLSWGGGSYSQANQDVIDYAWGQGAVIIAAAGNGGGTAPHYPAAYDHVVAVAMTSTTTDNLGTLSNYGTWVDICAPGTSIYSTLPLHRGTYGSIGGTSMSTPMVAGAAALVKAQFPDSSNHGIVIQLAAGADNIDEDNPDEAGLLGYGRLNIAQSLVPGTTSPRLSLNTWLSDTLGGDADGIPEAGETIRLYVTLENQFLGGSGINFSLALSSDDYALTMVDGLTDIAEILSLSSVTNTADPFVFTIEETAIPHRAVFTLDITADGGYQETFTFGEALGRAPILLVDDDDGANNVEGYYFEALDSLGMPFQYWPHVELGNPTSQYLQQFGTLIWLCEWNFPSLDSTDRIAIGSFLGSGGRLFLSGQDIGWDLCDTGSEINEYFDSDGASLTWYEDNLHAHYIADDATPGGQASIGVSGLVDSPIGESLAFDISQPGRDSDNQYPSVIQPLGEAEAIFEYETGGYGATLWPGSPRLVNFGFGYEAITDSVARLVVMDRVLKWLNDFSVAHTPLKDTENTTGPREVTVEVAATAGIIDSVAIYWSLDGSVPFNIAPMTSVQPGTFTGEIPAQDAGATVHYFIFALTDNGFFQTSPVGAPLRIHTYDVGPDTEPPVIEQVTELASTIDNSGYYPIEAHIQDNLGVDTTKVYLHYWKNVEESDSVGMNWDESRGIFTGAIDFGGILATGDTVQYFASAHDSSSSSLRTESTVAEFAIVSELLVDDFESGITGWSYSEGWGQHFVAHSGDSSFTDSPTGYYANKSESILERTVGYNLSTRESAYLTFWHIDIILTGDSALVELSPDGSTWQVAKVFTNTGGYDWERVFVSMADYVGDDDVRFRFRLVSDGKNAADGWYLDDIVIYVDTTGLGIEPADRHLPARYALKQNYPNPFNPTTVIEYHLPGADKVTLDIYNLRGQLVKRLVDREQPAGVHTVTFNAGGMASGIYFYRLQTAGFTRTRKMLILK